MASPAVSVILPVYNYEKYVGEALDSIVSQTLEDIEIIIIDDASTDKSWEVCRKYAVHDPRIQLFRNEENMGVSWSRNFGLEKATGKYVAFLDADDIFLDTFLEKMLGRIKETGADICICQAYNWNPEKNTVKKIPFKVDDEILPDFDGFTASGYADYIFNFTQFWPWNKLFKRDLLVEKKIRYPVLLRQYEDFVFSAKGFTEAEKISILPEFLVLHRLHEESLFDERKSNVLYNALKEVKKALAHSGVFEIYEKSLLNFAYEHMWGQKRVFAKKNAPIPQPVNEHWVKQLRLDRIAKDSLYFSFSLKPYDNFLAHCLVSLTTEDRIFRGAREVKLPEKKKTEPAKTDSVSIILPVHNSAPILHHTLESLRSQTYRNIEIMCVDDGSTDDSRGILELYAKIDPRFKIIQQAHAGTGAARNAALEKATGKYVMFCDANICYVAEMVAKMVKAIRDKKTDLVSCRAKGRPNDRVRNHSESNFLKGFHKLDDEKRLKSDGTVRNKIFRTDFIKRFKLDFPECCGHDNKAFVQSYLGVSDTMYGLDEELYELYAKAPADAASADTAPEDRNAILHAHRHIRDCLEKNGLLGKNKYFYLMSLNQDLRLGWQFLDENQKDSYLQIARDIIRNISFKNATNFKLLLAIKYGQFRIAKAILDKNRLISSLKKIARDK